MSATLSARTPARSATSAAFDGPTRVVLLVSLAGLLLVVLVALLAPPVEDDPTPATWNTGSHGTRAALLLLGALGYEARVVDQPLPQALGLHPAPARTTLILADPQVPADGLEAQQQAIAGFLQMGGTVLATGLGGAALLGRDEVRPAVRMLQNLCLTMPEGAGPLARVGSVPTNLPAIWVEDATSGSALLHPVPAKSGEPAPDAALSTVAQRCGQDAVVVRWQVGAGTATWWASPMPLTNLGLHNTASLRLLLASLTPAATAPKTTQRRIVLFDESLHGDLAAGAPDPLSGLPLSLLLAQAVLVALLLLFSFSRRRLPIRASAGTQARTSPVEFARSMGALYSRAGATALPVQAAQRRLLRALSLVAGCSAAALAAGPQAIAADLRCRYGAAPRWGALAMDLERTADHFKTEVPGERLSVADAMRLVHALDDHVQALPRTLRDCRTLSSNDSKEDESA